MSVVFFPLSKVEIRVISSSVKEKSNIEIFSLIWNGLLDPGIATTPLCKCHLKITWAAVLLWLLAIWTKDLVL